MKRTLLFVGVVALVVGLGSTPVFGGPGGVIPTPPYCPECQPCTSNRHCGVDPNTGVPLGVCTTTVNNYCHQAGVCVCY
ncbi:MAG TPA: hypothetical protein VMW27_14920 [Thermoanaerobaculia bacterium]|nr:hypothetical protein [Thermoanaerobaculia bacterium]